MEFVNYVNPNTFWEMVFAWIYFQFLKIIVMMSEWVNPKQISSLYIVNHVELIVFLLKWKIILFVFKKKKWKYWAVWFKIVFTINIKMDNYFVSVVWKDFFMMLILNSVYWNVHREKLFKDFNFKLIVWIIK